MVCAIIVLLAVFTQRGCSPFVTRSRKVLEGVHVLIVDYCTVRVTVPVVVVVPDVPVTVMV